jgi:HSP20 family molecular chaperone IbpA
MSPQELQVQKKREQDGKEEGTIPVRTFLPTADIYEDRDSLKILLEMPGVEKGNVNVHVEDGVLFVEGRSIWPNTEAFNLSTRNTTLATIHAAFGFPTQSIRTRSLLN